MAIRRDPPRPRALRVVTDQHGVARRPRALGWAALRFIACAALVVLAFVLLARRHR
jgi:hypothetical protein